MSTAVETKVKQCKRCMCERPLTEFRRRAVCRSCEREADRVRYQARSEQVRAAALATYYKNIERARTYYQANAEKLRAYAKAKRQQAKEAGQAVAADG
jgi:hypothetical protein